MGSSQSIEAIENDHVQIEEEQEEEDEDDDLEEEEDDDDDNDTGIAQSSLNNNHLLLKKVLEQEPEMLPCYASASPLSPQLSSLGTPRLGPSIKVWDPYNVLAPPPQLPPPPVFSRCFSSTSVQSNNNGIDDERMVTEVYLISHGECELDLRADLVSGRCVNAGALTGNGKRQARALAVFLNSQGVRFNAVYASPLDRARATAVSVCQEMNFAEERIQSFDELAEMSYGHWEGCLRSEVYTPEILSLIDQFQSDFSAPSGESIRQVQFRMVQFLNKTVLGLPEKLRSDFSSTQQNESQVHDRDGSSSSLQSHNWDLLHRQRLGFTRKKSGKSRLQFVTKTGNNEADDDFSPRNSVNDQMNSRGSTSSITSFVGIFSHSVPIKCLITGLLECSPVMSHKICIDDPSVSVLQHSWRTGWQIKRLNDTAHLRLV